MILAVDARLVVEPIRVEAEKHVQFITRPALGLVDLAVLGELFRKMFHRRAFRIFENDRRVEGSPEMLIEPAADHIVCVKSGVNPLIIVSHLLAKYQCVELSCASRI